MKKLICLFMVGCFALHCQICRADWEKGLGKAFVRPNQSLGSVSLGFTRNALIKKLGRPTRSDSSGGLVSDTWSRDYPDRAWYEQPFLTVYYSKSKAVQIDARLEEMFLSDYFSLNNTFAQLRKRFKGLKLIKSSSIDEGEPPRSFYYDDIKSGIGFFFMTGRGKVSLSSVPINVSIHRKGYKMVGL